ncbi:MAG TPA: DUF3592 domain-containing protein [Vicinamibacterales bacterium]|nr:DUF3592 domain-containing protein [Vicinamibacterales bacterium]
MDVERDDPALRERVADLQRGFAPPPELGSRPRDVELTGGGRALHAVIMALFAVAFIVPLAINGQRRAENADRIAFQTRSVSATAEVRRLWRTSGENKQSRVEYAYTVGDRRYERVLALPLARWRELQVGSTLAIRYLSDEPSRSRLEGAESGSIPAWLPILVGLAIISAPILMLALLNRQRRLLAEGRPAPAVVTKVVKHHSSHGGSHRSMRYAFPVLSGAMATGRAGASRKGIAEGSVICIIYDPDRPGRSQPYPFPLVRPAQPAK